MEPSLHIVLHEPEIPQNTGNIGRTCVAVGAKLWLVRPLGFRLDDARMRRAGLDYWSSLQWQDVADWNELRRRLPDRNIWLFTKSGARDYDEIQYAAGDVLVFGSETAGLPPSLREANPDRTVRIPMRPPVRSLNLSNAVAVAAYAALPSDFRGTC